MLIMKPKDQKEFVDTLVDKDIIGLDPRYNLITPFDLVLGTYTKGYQGAKGVYAGTKLIHAGFSGFGKRALLMGLVDLYGFGTKTVDMFDHFTQSRGGRDAKPVSGQLVGPVLRPRQIKPSRPVSSGQTSRPFWANGKPKCKKGFRYDFKRKLCVKIK
ncbi:MAG: hypothetical protein [Circular genetic element sp.]|nr:MAG: hypothetical protein [Circular genetic element sp.]